MENQENLTSEQLAEIEGLPLHEAASKILGKEFPDTASAAKALKDTFGYVARAGEGIKIVDSVMSQKGFKTSKEAVEFINTLVSGQQPPKEEKPVVEKQPEAPKIDPKEFVPRSEFDQQNFYSNHPEYKGHEKLVETFMKANPGMTREQIVSGDSEASKEFKAAFEPIKAAKQKSIMHSDSKIGAVKDKMEEAREKSKTGNPADQTEATKMATKSVMDAFEL